MENNIDKLFREGLSADKIEDLSLYSNEKSQWKVVQSQLHTGKKRWLFAKFLPLLLLVGVAGALLYVSYPSAEIAMPLAVEEMTSFSVEEEAIGEEVFGENNDFGTEVKAARKNIKNQVLVGKEVLANDATQTNADIAVENSVNLAERNSANESYRPINKESEYGSTANAEMNAKDDVVMTNRSSEEANSNSSTEDEKVSSDSPYSYGSATNHYGEKSTETAANYDYGTARQNLAITPDDKEERMQYSGGEIASLEMARVEEKANWKWSIVPEDFYQPRLSWWKSLRRGISFRIGIDGPIHFNHSEVLRSGFGYDLGTDFDLSDRWGISADYIYQEIDREITSELASYNLPVKSNLYQELDIVKSSYTYTSHTVLVGFRYSMYQKGRLHIGLLPSFEVSGRGKAQADFFYEGPYQQEEENFEFESKLISANNLSLGIIAEYRLFARVHLVGRFRRQIPVGTGEDWKLYNRAFVGLSYKI